MTEHSSVQSLDRAFDLLEILCRSRGGMSIGALSAETGLHKSTVHRLLASMCTRGYVQRDAETSMYRAGMRLCEMSSYIVDNLDVVDRARAVMERLGRETDETVHLVMRDENDVVYIHKIDSGNSAIRMFSRIGNAASDVLHGRGQGHSFDVAALRGARGLGGERRLFVDREHGHGRGGFLPRNRQGASARLRARQRGKRDGVRCIAAAIPDYRGHAFYAISLSAPATRMPDERIIQLRGPLLCASRDIAQALGGVPGR